jgi:hypothetical protein
MNRLLIFLMIVLTASCNREPLLQLRERPFITYVIPAGSHFSSQSTFKAFQDSVLKFTVRFDSSAIYSNREASNQGDINKLYGFAEEGSHHENSARFGWNWENRKLNLYAYSYVEGERHSYLLGEAEIGNEYNCSIRLSGNDYVFQFNNNSHSIPRAINTKTATGYLLYPYFGGDETAPHEIRIYIRP